MFWLYESNYEYSTYFPYETYNILLYMDLWISKNIYYYYYLFIFIFK